MLWALNRPRGVSLGREEVSRERKRHTVRKKDGHYLTARRNIRRHRVGKRRRRGCIYAVRGPNRSRRFDAPTVNILKAVPRVERKRAKREEEDDEEEEEEGRKRGPQEEKRRIESSLESASSLRPRRTNRKTTQSRNVSETEDERDLQRGRRRRRERPTLCICFGDRTTLSPFAFHLLLLAL